MKKSLITLFAMAGLASGATMSLDITANNDTTGHGYTGADAALTSFANNNDGGYLFNAGGVVQGGADGTEGVLTSTADGICVTLCPRTGAGGSGEAIVISGTELNDLTVTSLTFSVASSECSSTADIAMTLAVITNGGSGTSWTVLDKEVGAITLNSAGEVTLDLDESITWSDSYKVVAMVDNTAKTLGGGGSPTYTLKGIEVTAEYASVPEPATASLSLLGLAALMIRRRR